MNEQFSLLEWIYDNQENFPLKSGKIYQAYQETEDYDAGQNSFSELLSKLHDKGFLEKPDYGVYDISENGENRVLTLRGKDLDEFKTPENYEEVVDELIAFLMEEKDDEVHRNLMENSALQISLEEIDRFNSDVVYEFMRENFESFVDAFDEALSEVVMNSGAPEWEFLPDLEYLDTDLQDAKGSEMIDEPVIIEGLVRKTTEMRPEVVSAVFECTQCGDRYEKEQDSAQLKSPYKCDCGSKKFECVDKNLIDAISFEVSQRDEKETVIDCSYKNATSEDAKKLMSGKRVKLLAVPRETALKKNSKKLKVWLEVHSYQLTERKLEGSEYGDEERKEVIKKVEEAENPFKKYWKSLAPQVAARELPKKCIAVGTMGAPVIENQDAEFGRIHVGFVSNPGMAKSGLLKSVRNTFNNVYLSAGGNATGTALTASAEQSDGGEWELIAGKVVFADKGFLQIDEFDKFDKGELVKLNSAIEDGYFPVDKGTIRAELPGRATVMLSGNFQRKLDTHTKPYEILPEKGQGLYDRIPLLCAITENSSEVTNKVIENYANGPNSEVFDPYFTEKELRIYRDLGQNYSPEVTPEAQKHVKKFYEGSSGYSDEGVRGKSMRPLVNLMKITMAMARFDLSEEATTEHAEQACKLFREARHSLGLDLGEKPSERMDIHKIDEKLKENSKEETIMEEEELVGRVLDELDVDRSYVRERLDTLKSEGEFQEIGQGEIEVLS